MFRKNKDKRIRCEVFAESHLSWCWLDCLNFQKTLPDSVELAFNDFFLEVFVLQSFLLARVVPVVTPKWKRLILDSVSEFAYDCIAKYVPHDNELIFNMHFKLLIAKLSREYFASAWSAVSVANEFQQGTIYSVTARRHFASPEAIDSCLTFLKNGTRHVYAELTELILKLEK